MRDVHVQQAEKHVEKHVLMCLLTGCIAGNVTMLVPKRFCVCKGPVSRLAHLTSRYNVMVRVSPLMRTPSTAGHAVWYAGRGRLVFLGLALAHLDKRSVVDHVSTQSPIKSTVEPVTTPVKAGCFVCLEVVVRLVHLVRLFVSGNVSIQAAMLFTVDLVETNAAQTRSVCRVHAYVPIAHLWNAMVCVLLLPSIASIAGNVRQSAREAKYAHSGVVSHPVVDSPLRLALVAVSTSMITLNIAVLVAQVA
jgi:hypothetical protein